MSGIVRLVDASDQVLAWLALAFASLMAVAWGLFDGSPWRPELFFGLQFLAWTTTALAVAMAAAALHHLGSPDRTGPGTLLAVVALVHAPVHLVLVFGLVAAPTLRGLSTLAAWVLFPLLALSSAVVVLRPVLRGWLPALTPHERS
ncbi:hypothetical protein [Haloglomus litoreum]|uniref:hypothetical protein n=1 Tax=Haloglomus litoreum TaxID=3034026 RepID=UPI0023E84AF6|nr:hypothetical protein [Haloglomus sp. DT116]